MHELKKLIKDELHEYGKKKELCISDVEPICYLIKAYKGIMEICDMEDKEDRKRIYKEMGYPDMQADGMINFSYMSGDGKSDYADYMDYPEQYRMKGYNPLRVRPYRNMPERSGMWGQEDYGNRTMNRMDGMYGEGMNRYNDNRGRYVNMPEVYSQGRSGMNTPSYSRNKNYDPSRSMNHKHTESDMMDYEISDQEIQMWLKEMENEDGTRGAHWTKEQTTPLAKSHGVMLNEDVDETIWNLVMNIVYSDNCKTAKKYGVDKPDYYADLAKDWLEDEDGLQGREKVSAYYENIVKAAE